jgi:hypothetical protein
MAQRIHDAHTAECCASKERPGARGVWATDRPQMTNGLRFKHGTDGRKLVFLNLRLVLFAQLCDPRLGVLR